MPLRTRASMAARVVGTQDDDPGFSHVRFPVSAKSKLPRSGAVPERFQGDEPHHIAEDRPFRSSQFNRVLECRRAFQPRDAFADHEERIDRPDKSLCHVVK